MTGVQTCALPIYIRDLVVDDSLYLYVNLRAGIETSLDGNSGQGLATEKYRITGTLPVTRADTLWSYAWPSSGGVRPNGIAIWRGSNLTSNVDDILYVSVVDDGTPGVRDGIWEFKNLSAKPPTVTQVYKPSGTFADISNRADLAVDVVGNIILFENTHEHIYFVSPPHGANSYTTNSPTGVFITVTVATGVEATDNSLPQEYSLSQNYPNPFNPTTTIQFKVPVSGNVRVAVYDILGREVFVLTDDFLQAGNYKVVFDARNLSSGTYFYTLTARDVVLRNKMVLLK